jgi:protein arginine N-methyltransferase 2
MGPDTAQALDAFHRPRGSEADSAYLLQDGLEINEEVIMDEHGYAVMMKWEQPLMQAHADFICGSRIGGEGGGSGSDVSANQCGAMLNIGFGMGLVDDAIQSHSPALHVICEAHPKVLARAEAWAKVNPFLKTRSHPVSASPEPLQK